MTNRRIFVQPVFELLLLLFSVGVLAFAFLMATKIFPYFRFEPIHGFLGTKTDRVLAKPHFQIAFYIHIASSFFVMVAGALQVLPALYRRWPRLHRSIGRVYVLGILLLAAPSGLGLAVYANGGLSAKVGFTLQCLVWWILTFQAWQWARKQQWEKHSAFMLCSLAVTLAAMSLRLESYWMVQIFGTKPIETYLTVTWLSWVGNLLLANLLIQMGWSQWMMQVFFVQKKPSE
jgi:hypothetical protein